MSGKANIVHHIDTRRLWLINDIELLRNTREAEDRPQELVVESLGITYTSNVILSRRSLYYLDILDEMRS